MNCYFSGFYRCVNSGDSLKNFTESPLDFNKIVSESQPYGLYSVCE